MVSKVKLFKPELAEVASVLGEGLKKNFSEVTVSVTDCPDLTRPPFHLAAEGLCGNPRIADVGGVPYLSPVPNLSKIYKLREVLKQSELPNAFVIGPGAGPFAHVGVNCELMANAALKQSGEGECLNTHIAKVDPSNGAGILEKFTKNDEFSLMGNFLISEGKPGKVIKVVAKHRTGEENFVTCMRKALGERFGDKTVGIGGSFLIETGKAKLHIMPDFSPCPLNTSEEIDNWLNYYEMSAPLVCLSVFESFDPGLDLRVEHTHCFSTHGEGGHYHYDTTPAEVSYVGYFVVADFLYRIDQP